MGNGMPNQIISLLDANTFLKIGNLCFKNKKYLKSISYLKKALKLDPNHLDVHLLLADIYQALSNPAQAIIHFEEAASLRKTDWQLKRLLIDLYLVENQYSKASNLLILRLHWRKGDLNWWRRFKNRLFRNQNELEKILFQLTYILREEEKHLLALKYGKKLVRRKDNTISHYLLATIYESLSDYPKTQKEFLKVTKSLLQITPQFYAQVYAKIKENLLIPQEDAI